MRPSAKRRRVGGGSPGAREDTRAASPPAPWDADEIVPGLWLGSLDAAEDAAALTARGVALVISLHTERQASPPAGVRWVRIQEYDAADTDLLQHWRTLSADVDAVLVVGAEGGAARAPAERDVRLPLPRASVFIPLLPCFFWAFFGLVGAALVQLCVCLAAPPAPCEHGRRHGRGQALSKS